MQMIRSATEADLTRITKAYVATARTLVRAGFDVLELHMAHSYLISSFLAPGLNRRKDGYGGSLENRARLGRQVARAVRDEVGGEVAVTAKVVAERRLQGRGDDRRGARVRPAARVRRHPRRAAAERRLVADEPDVPLPRRGAARRSSPRRCRSSYASA